MTENSATLTSTDIVAAASQVLTTAGYRTVTDASSQWNSATSRLFEESWDGYLVLLTSAVAPSEDTDIEAVRYNTTRVRKIVATGDELRTIADVERVLRPLLPLSDDATAMDNASALDVLPRLLSEQGIAEETTRALVDAFRSQSPLIERLYEKEGQQ
jgi:hypothetical protein